MSLILLLLLGLATSINQKCDIRALSTQSDELQTAIELCPENSKCFPDRYCRCLDGFIGGCSQQALAVQN
jgi:hypothetical protein